MANDGSVVIGTELDDSGFKSGLSGLGGIATKGLKVAGIALGAAVTAVGKFGTDSVKAGMQFDSAMSQVAATMGLTTDQIGNLRDYALEMGANTAFSASEAAEALNYMALAGYDAQTSMEMLPTVLDLAAAGGIELARASDMVTDAQSALGLSLEETATLVDQMARTSSKSNTSVGQLGEAMLTVGGTARNLAGGTTELNTVLGLLADNGIKGAEGGTALRNVILSLTAPTDQAAKKMKELGLEVFDANGNMRPMEEIFTDLNDVLSDMTQGEQTQVLSEIFNKVDLKSVNALLNTNVKRWRELSGEIKNADGAAKAMAETQLDNLAGDVTLFKSALEGAQITLSDALTPALRSFVQMGTAELGKLDKAFQMDGINGLARQLGKSLGEAATMVLDAVPTMIEAGAELALALAQSIGDRLISDFPYILRKIGQLALKIGGALADALPDAMRGIGTLIGEIIADIPYMLTIGAKIIAGIAEGIISGLPGLVEGFQSGISGFLSSAVGEEVLEAQRSLDEIRKSFADFVTQTQADIDEAFTGIDSKASEAEAWLKVFEDLSQKTSLTRDEQLKLNAAVEALNGILPETSQIVQDETGQWIANTEEIRNNIEALKARAKAEVYQEKAKETMREIVDLQEKQTQTATQYQEALARSTDAQAYVDSLRSSHAELSKVLANTKLVGNDWKKVESGLSKETKAWAAANGITIDSNANLVKAMAALETQMSSAQAEASNTAQAADVLKATYDELGSQIEQLEGQFDDLWTKASQQSSKAAEAGVKSGESYAKGLKTTAKNAKEAGAEVLAAAMDGTNSSTGMSANGAKSGNAYASGVGGASGSARASGSSLRSAAESGASGGNFYGIGYNAGAGFASGISAAEATVRTAAGGLVNAALGKMKSVALVRSPSRLTRDKVGIPMGEGVAVGLEESLGEIDSVLDREINGAISEENRRLTSGNLVDAERAVTAETDPRYVETTIEMDGRKVAKATTPYVSKELAWSK